MTQLADKTVKELRVEAKRRGIKQVTADGSTKNKDQLLRSIRTHDSHGHTHKKPTHKKH